MGTVHQFPVPRNPPATAPAQELARALRLAIDVQVGADAPFAAREVAALALTNEATRLFLQSDLLAIADRHGSQVEVDGVIYQRHEPTVRYFTLCGALDLERWTYREIGVRNGPTIVPLELAAGLVEHTSPALGVRIALGYAKDHMRRSCRPITGARPRAVPWNGWPRRSGPRPRAWRPASPRACGGRSGCRRGPSPSRWGSTAPRSPWRRTSRPASRTRRAARHGRSPTPARNQPR